MASRAHPEATSLLQRRPRLRRLAAVLWVAFMGGALNFAVMLSLPAAWFEPGSGLAALSLLFFCSWAVALAPALAAWLLAEASSHTRP